MAQSKATKKFEKNRLKDTLQRRKDFAKVKQRHQVNAKKKARRAAENTSTNGAKVEQQGKEDEDGQHGKAMEKMDVDEFFAGGFDVEKSMQDAKSHKPSKKRKRVNTEVVGIEATSLKPSNRRTTSDVEEDGTDAITTHKKDLDALASTDPEFYRHLQEEDPELLDFAEDTTLAEMDELSDSEDEIKLSGKQRRGNKYQREGSSDQDVTKALVKKWTLAMQEKHSLRAVREVVLAFRAAAHLNEETEKTYKYTISNADGTYFDLRL